MHRTYDLSELPEVMGKYRDDIANFDPDNWIANPENIALTDGDGSFVLLQEDGPGVYYVHNFYKKRGRDAVRLAKEATKYAFDNFPLEIAKGLTPVEHLGAKWLSRQAGFKSYGIIQTPDVTITVLR